MPAMLASIVYVHRRHGIEESLFDFQLRWKYVWYYASLCEVGSLESRPLMARATPTASSTEPLPSITMQPTWCFYGYAPSCKPSLWNLSHVLGLELLQLLLHSGIKWIFNLCHMLTSSWYCSDDLDYSNWNPFLWLATTKSSGSALNVIFLSFTAYNRTSLELLTTSFQYGNHAQPQGLISLRWKRLDGYQQNKHVYTFRLRHLHTKPRIGSQRFWFGNIPL